MVVYCSIAGLATLGAVEFAGGFFPGTYTAAAVATICIGIFGLTADVTLGRWRGWAARRRTPAN